MTAALSACVLGWALSTMTLSPTDAYVYLLAGERLNAGHELYALQPGDVVIAPSPPYWTVPFLSPPLLGVLWRPLAALGVPGMFIGWGVTAGAVLATVALITRARPLTGVAAAALLAAPIGDQLGLGNVNGFLALGLVAAWRSRDRPFIVGALVALLASVKLVPVVMVAWLVATRRWKAVAACALSGAGLLAVAAAGSSPAQVLQYLDVMAATTSGGSTGLSAAGVLRTLGVTPELARWAPWAIVGGGCAVVLTIGRRRPGLAYGLAVVLMVAGSPVVYPYWFALLIAALAPWAWRATAAGTGDRAVRPAGHGLPRAATTAR